MKKTLLVLVILAIVGLLGWQIYRKVTQLKKGGGRGRRAVAVAVEVAPVRKATIRDVGLFTGSLLPKSQFTIAPKVPGRLEKLLVNIGDRVKQGQLIAVLDSEELVQQLEQARAELNVAKANVAETQSALEVANREFKRAKELHQQAISSEASLDTAEAQYKAKEAKQQVALAQVAQKEAELRAAQVRLSYTQIRASWQDGEAPRIVGQRFVDEGTMLKANDPIVSILDIHTVTALIYVIEREYPKLQVGREAVVSTDAFPGKTFAGRIARVAPLLKETSRQARVEIELPNPAGLLKPGMFVRAAIEFAKHADATVVPVAALARRNGKRGVFQALIGTKKARFVAVRLGIVNGELAEVVRPALGGWVVTLGHHLLEDGSAITLPDTAPPGASLSKAPAGKPGPEDRR